MPQFWVPINFAATDGKDMLIKKEGTASLKITGAIGKAKGLKQTLSLSGITSDKFTLSFWLRGISVPVAGLCQAQVLLYNGTTLKAGVTSNCPTGTFPSFQKMTLNLTAPTAYTSVVIKFTYTKTTGSIWFDGVSLMK